MNQSPMQSSVTVQDRNRDVESNPGMVRIPAGSFLMGSHDGGAFERSVHPVWLDDFYLDATLVTNEQFAEFVAATSYVSTAERKGSAWGSRDGTFAEIAGLSWRSYAGEKRRRHPVVLVSWGDADAYASWARKRLPTEAEWEKAARGGLEGLLYPWGQADATTLHTGYGRSASEMPATSPVASFAANGFGLYDMVGNVWQWCADWYAGDYYDQSPARDPKGPDAGELRVRRGAAWNIVQTFRLRCANRGAVSPETIVPNMGFRCAADVPPRRDME